MSKFIFTFGYDDGGGWAEIEAQDFNEAIELFNARHPKRNGFVACSTMYTEKSFNNTEMPKKGNFGRYCVEHIESEER